MRRGRAPDRAVPDYFADPMSKSKCGNGVTPSLVVRSCCRTAREVFLSPWHDPCGSNWPAGCITSCREATSDGRSSATTPIGNDRYHNHSSVATALSRIDNAPSRLRQTVAALEATLTND